MLQRYIVTLHHVITVYNDIFDHMDGVMRALAKKNTQLKKDLYIAMKFVWQKLSKYHTEVSPTTSRHLISAHILDPFRKLRLLKKCDKGSDINPEDETSYNIQKQEVFLKYVEDENCSKHQRLPVTKPDSVPNHNLLSFRMVSRSGQSSYDHYDLSSNDEEYLMHKNVYETTPGRSDPAACSSIAARVYSNSPLELPQHRGAN